MYLKINDISWYSRDYEGIMIIFSCGNFPNVPLMEIVGGINYNLILALRQLGYLMLDKPDTKLLDEFVLTEGVDNP